MEDKLSRLVYTLFLGVTIALFFGFGIQTFYPSPDFPRSTEAVQHVPEGASDQELLEQQKADEAAYRDHEQKSEVYNRNVSTISLVAAVALLGTSMLLGKRNRVITNGIMLGGLFTLLYSFGRGMASGDTTMTFVAVTVGLAVVLFLGTRRFLPATAADPGEKPPLVSR
ncbi:putative membrane protein [Arthrobacter sp. CAN_A214]|uniref:hypothetical protein n=1 Tax=Arthrobacter sp. CAN_A214 TaxID=2787720 RepID=UPI0018CB0B15